jgi:ribonuclease Z
MLSGIIMQHRLKYTVTELSSGIFYKDKHFSLECKPLDHITPCLAYSLKEQDKRKLNLSYLKKFKLKQHPLLGKLQKGQNITYKGKKISAKQATKLIPGKKVTIIMDTAPTKNADKIAKNSDLLITEATWGRELEKFVKKRKHLTAQLAAKIAKQSHSKKLILTHFSQRYKDVQSLEKEAKKIFKNSVTAKDFMEIKV